MGAPCGASFPHTMCHLERPRLDIQNRKYRKIKWPFPPPAAPTASGKPAPQGPARTGWGTGACACREGAQANCEGGNCFNTISYWVMF